MNNQNTSLLTLINSDEAREISCIVRTKMDEFKTLPPGAKLKLVDSLYEQNQLFKGLGEKAIETIEDMDEEIEMKDNEIKVLKKELKSINSYDYDDKKIEEILISNPFARSNDKRERAKKRLMKTLAKSERLHKKILKTIQNTN